MGNVDGKLKALINKAQRFFGPRDGSFEILPVNLLDYPEGPATFYPEGYEARRVEVRLHSPDVSNYPQRLHYQLAHEAVHLLAPSPPNDVNRRAPLIEEGFAVWFSLEQSRADYAAGNIKNMPETYGRALGLAKDFFGHARPPQIKSFRQKFCANFHEWTPQILTDELKIPPKMAELACSRIQMR